MNPIYHGDQDGKNFYEAIEKLNDRELQEKQAFYLRNIQRSNQSIKNNVQFFFYLSIVAILLGFFIAVQLR